MKRSIAVVACITIVSGSAWAQSAQTHGAMPGMNGASSSMISEAKATVTHRLSGTVKKVDVKAKSVTVDHAAVQTLNWPAMTMTFKVEDPAIIAKLKTGAKIDADMIERGHDYVIVALR